MRHLAALAKAGLSDVHLLPVFDLASVPEAGCTTPAVPAAAPDSADQQAAVMAEAAGDCFNWGYDPLHFNAPEGSYASRADDGALRIREFRQMVLGLHRAGLRVGMDMVYNHSSASGQHRHSVLDRIVPGYYHRLDAAGAVERSTCCDNTATEHRMMRKLMLDSVRLWARAYRLDSFRFDLMGHQPREAMEALRDALRADNGRDIPLIGEGWNFGEVKDGARFVQASQASLNGSGIATFSDRGRDALRGGGVGDAPAAVVARQGVLNGLGYDPNEAARAAGAPDTAALKAGADLVRLALAGTLRSYAFTNADGIRRRGDQMRYADQIAGYAGQPGEVVNYVENHDNPTLWDLNAYKLPLDTPAAERARVQVLGLAFTAFSQGMAYFHAGVDVLRSKSMDRDSFDSGDWFNRLDWTCTDNHFGSGLPPEKVNAASWPLIAPRLADARLKPAPADIAFARDAFRDLLRIRASSRLFRLDSAEAVQQRLQMHNTGPDQNPVLFAGELDGAGLAGAGFRRVMYLVNVDKLPQALALDLARGRPWVLHPVHRAAQAADRRAATEATFDAGSGRFSVPARTAVVYVLP
jgi:pullulanase-type alpha-1,6-glucosidase